MRPIKKDPEKEGFRVRRQAEKQQTVYRLIPLCAQELVVASCKGPPPNFLSPRASNPSPPLRLTFLEFLAAASNVGIFLQQELICLVLHLLLPLTEPVNALRYYLCVLTLCLCVFEFPFSPPSGKPLCIIVTGDNSQNSADFLLACASRASSR